MANESSDTLVSIVVSVYGCRACLAELLRRLKLAMKELNAQYEIILVNDRSPDDAWAAIKDLASDDLNIKGILFSRNHGQHYAITAGLDHANGDYVVVMDCDLQDRPEDVPLLVRESMKGIDVVYGYSNFRGRSTLTRSLMRKIYFRTYDLLTNAKAPSVNLSFFVVNRKVRNVLIQYREAARHISSLVREVGFTMAGVEVTHVEREVGASSYTFAKRLRLAIDGILTYSTFVLKLAAYLGFLISATAFLSALVVIYNRLFQDTHYPGWASLAVLILFSTGSILFFLGMLGVYVDKVFIEAKKRPLYIIDETVNL